jgi:hypothetical protein
LQWQLGADGTPEIVSGCLTIEKFAEFGCTLSIPHEKEGSTFLGLPQPGSTLSVGLSEQVGETIQCLKEGIACARFSSSECILRMSINILGIDLMVDSKCPPCTDLYLTMAFQPSARPAINFMSDQVSPIH